MPDRSFQHYHAIGRHLVLKCPVVVREGEVYRPKLLPGFELVLADLLAAADRWKEPA